VGLGFLGTRPRNLRVTGINIVEAAKAIAAMRKIPI